MLRQCSAGGSLGEPRRDFFLLLVCQQYLHRFHNPELRPSRIRLV